MIIFKRKQRETFILAKNLFKINSYSVLVEAPGSATVFTGASNAKVRKISSELISADLKSVGDMKKLSEILNRIFTESKVEVF